MSNLYFNIRFGKYHLQIGKDMPYISIMKNTYWDTVPYEKWFEVYHWFGKYKP